MGQKALKGLAVNACRIFLGWQIYKDLPEIERLGKGKYEIGLLTSDCRKDGAVISSLGISGIVGKWFTAQLKVNNITLQEIKRAVLIVDVVDIWEKTHTWGGRENKISCFKFDCSSYIHAYGREYTAQESGQQEFV